MPRSHPSSALEKICSTVLSVTNARRKSGLADSRCIRQAQNHIPTRVRPVRHENSLRTITSSKHRTTEVSERNKGRTGAKSLTNKYMYAAQLDAAQAVAQRVLKRIQTASAADQ